ncbi:kinase-like domain-containing protein [Mycena metata]|uniref:Kinase-like domain-containing protein n=1 Tax=Mycena metata TaxID=1033252 RepID=A0AAD7NWW0_9AGAR|nr:kinase-like domain-containing protein [Mycena metata]
MVSPWMEHGTVMRYLQEHGHADVDKLLYEIAQGLQYLHSQHIVHGDLRGNNILITQDWRACLADFGLSIVSNATSSMSTNRGGSAYWMAPELLAPDRFGFEFARTPASDVYAYGCVCLELYTGKPPFAGLREPAALLKVLGGERPERPLTLPLMSDTLWQHITTYWAENPTARPETQLVVQNMVWPTLTQADSPPAESNEPSRERRREIIPQDEDMRRLLQECKISVGIASILSDALETTPFDEQLITVNAFLTTCIE